MIRTALRLSTWAALTNGGAEPYPTLVGKHVYDSRKDDLSDLDTPMPVLVIRTDEDRRLHRDPRTGAPNDRAPIHRTIALRIEASVMSAAVDENGNVLQNWPITDPGIEAMLDFLEWQIENALMGYKKWALWWQSLWARDEAMSVPIWTDQNSDRLRLAIREMTLSIRAPYECIVRPMPNDNVTVRDTNGDPVLEPEIPPPLDKVLDKIITEGQGDMVGTATRLRTQLLTRDWPLPEVIPMLTSVRMRMPEAKTPAGMTPGIVLDVENLNNT